MSFYQIKKRLSRDNPRWIVLLVDVLIVFCCYLFTNYVVNSFRGRLDESLMVKQAFLVTIAFGCTFILYKTYRGIIRQADIKDAQGIMSACSSALLVLMFLSFCLRQFVGIDADSIFNLSYAILFVHAILTMVSMVAARMVYKYIYEQLFYYGRHVEPIVLVGAGHMGNVTLNLLKTDTRNRYKIVLIADDKEGRIGKRVNGFNVIDFRALTAELMEGLGIETVIIAR